MSIDLWYIIDLFQKCIEVISEFNEVIFFISAYTIIIRIIIDPNEKETTVNWIHG